jgi:Flp pilus assembly protein TadD
MKHRNWLDVAEYFMLLGSGVGTLASVASQQVVYTAAPLSFLMLLNLVNRQRLQQQIDQEVTPTIAQVDQQLAEEIELLNRKIDTLPDAATVRQLRAIVMQKHHAAISQLSHKMGDLHQELIKQTAPLREHNLTVLHQDIHNLQLRSVNLEGSISELTAYLNQVAAATRVNDLEAASAQFSADLTYLKTDVANLQTNLQNLLEEQKAISPRTLQEQIDHLNRRLSNLPQPFDASSLKKDIDSLLNVITDLVSRRELSRLAAEFEKLNQQQRSLEQSVTTVRLASTVFRKQLDTVVAKLNAREETLNWLTGAVAFQAEPKLTGELKNTIAKLAKGLVVLQRRFNEFAALPERQELYHDLERIVTDQVEALQEQLASVQQTNQTLEQEQQDLRQLLTHLPDDDRSRSSQLSALIARIDWAEQRITQTESYWHSLQNQLGETVRSHLESLSQQTLTDLSITNLKQQIEQSITETVEPLQQQFFEVQHSVQILEEEQNNLKNQFQQQASFSNAASLEQQLDGLVDRVEWAETNLEHLQTHLETIIQSRLDDISEQLQRIFPDLETTSATLTDVPPELNAAESINPLLLSADREPDPTFAVEVEVQPSSPEQPESPDPEAPEFDLEVEAQSLSPEQPGLTNSEAPEFDLEVEAQPLSPEQSESTNPEVPEFDYNSDVTELLAEVSGDSRAMLENALEQTQERIIIVSPYPTPDTIDTELLQKFETVLQRGCQIDIGWGHLVDEVKIRTPRCLHQPALNAVEKGFIQEMLRQLAQMKQRYANQFRFKILGTHENFVVCDRSFALLGILPVATGEPDEPDDITGLHTDDVAVIQSLIDRFDAPNPDDNNAIAYFNRGTTRYDLGDKPGAITDFTQALLTSPKDDIIYTNRGLARYELGDRAGAIMDFNNAIQLNPTNATAYFNRGCARADLGDKLGSIADFSNAIQHQPDFAIAYFCRGIAHTRLSDRAAAIADYTEALHHNPQDAMSYFYRGVARFRSGDRQNATTDLRQAEKLFAEQKDKSNRHRVREAIRDLEEALVEANSEPEPKFWPL